MRLTDAAWGDRAGGNRGRDRADEGRRVDGVGRDATGRVFVSKNVDAEPVVGTEPGLGTRRVATSVTWSRIDLPTPATPNRYVTSIYVDPADGNHAWVSYSGYNVECAGRATSSRCTFNPATGTATWTNSIHDWGDLPVSDLVYDDVTGDLYASSDFGVSKLAGWHDELGARRRRGCRTSRSPGLTIVPEERRLFAATHGLSAWYLNLPR